MQEPMLQTLKGYFGSTGALGCLLATMLLGCGDDGTGDEPMAGNAAPAGPAASFAEVQAVFNGSCAFMSCHDSDAPVFNLDLQTDAHTAIVNVMAAGTPLPLVVPGDPEGSYLYQKITQDMPVAGGRMPPSGGELSADRIETIRSWIAGGALP